MSFWDNDHALFEENCFKSIASQVFSDATQPLLRIQDMSPPHPAEHVTVPHDVLLASFGIVSSALGPDLLCPWWIHLPLVDPLICFA